MGCVQAKPDSPSRGLDKFKSDHGYVPGLKRHKALAVEPEISTVVVGASNNVNQSHSNNNDQNKDLKNQKKKRKKRISAVAHVWPKWLADHIPPEILDGFVPRSADSYDKIANVDNVIFLFCKIGHGTYSNVYKARDLLSNKIVALKKVRFDTSEAESVKFMAREIVALHKLDHPNVVKLRGLATSRMQYSIYLVFDFMQSDFNKFISGLGFKLDEPQVKCYMQQLLMGLQHCHERGIMHRDLKSSNLLIDKHGTLKIADFGLSTLIPNKQKRPLTSRVVTLWYRAPELLLGSTDYGIGIDLWSAGCLLAEMFIGKPFMPGRTEVEQLHTIFKLCGAPSDDYWKRMKLMTSYRPAAHYKPSFEEAFKEFPSSAFRLLTQLLSLDPASRGTAASALRSDFFSTSPLACELSALPQIVAEENEPTRTKDKRRQKSLKWKKTEINCNNKKELFHEEKVTLDFPQFNQENNFEANYMLSQEMGTTSASTSTSTSSSNKQTGTEDQNNKILINASLSPIQSYNDNSTMKRFSRTEAHPNAIKNINPELLRNIKNYTLLQASVTDIINHKEGSALAQYFRSLSLLDFRNRDQNDQKISDSSFASEKGTD